jgi:hypothetical protein
MRILVADSTDARVNLRPKRHIDFLLQSGFQVDVLSLAVENTSDDSLRYFTLPKSRRLFSINWWIRFIATKWLPAGHSFGEGGSLYRRAVFGDVQEVFRTKYDLCIVENIDLLAGLGQFSNISRIIVDLREYHPGENEGSIRWRFLRKREVSRIYSRHVPKALGVFTVSERIRKKLKSSWNIDSKVLLSVCDQTAQNKPREASIPLKFVYHGLADPFRDLEFVIHCFGGLPHLTLTLVLVGHSHEITRLKKLSKRYGNVFFKEPVESKEIVDMLQEFDGGIAFFPKNNFNLIASMPNKFFEYITAGLLPVVANDTAMSDFISESSFGLIAEHEGPAGLRDLLTNLSLNEFVLHRQNLDRALTYVSPERQKEIFINEVRRVLKL